MLKCNQLYLSDMLRSMVSTSGKIHRRQDWVLNRNFLELSFGVVNCKGIVRQPSEEYSNNHLCFCSQDGRIFLFSIYYWFII